MSPMQNKIEEENRFLWKQSWNHMETTKKSLYIETLLTIYKLHPYITSCHQRKPEMPCKDTIMGNQELAARLGVDDIADSRCLNGKNKPQKVSPTSDYNQKQFVHVFQLNGLPDEEDTLESSVEFGKGMAHLFNKIGTSNKYSYTSHKIPVLR
jgi:hypothetical protein